jgi:hypothetical protein
MDYRLIYEDIMKTDPRVRFLTIFDTNGEIVYTGHREGVQNILSPEESMKSLQQAASAWKFRQELEPKLGRGLYALAVYEKIKRITVPLDDKHMAYITTEPDADHNKIIESLVRLSLSLEAE